MEVKLHALSSDGKTIYPVNFTFTDGVLRVHCMCKAGERGKRCKHVVSFLAGDPKLLADGAGEEAALAKVTQWVETTGFDKRAQEIVALEEQVKEAKAKLTRAKEQLWRELNKGFKG